MDSKSIRTFAAANRKSIGHIGKPLRAGSENSMYKFFSGKSKNMQTCTLSIEKKTKLLVLEQIRDNEEWPRYIRLTGQQVKRIQQMFFKGSFYSATKPSNYFTLENGVYTMCCRSENQVIKLTAEEMANVYQYYERHKERIAKYDFEFKK